MKEKAPTTETPVEEKSQQAVPSHEEILERFRAIKIDLMRQGMTEERADITARNAVGLPLD